MRYFVKIDDEWHAYSVADIKTLVVCIAKNYGVYTDLFLMAIIGCTTDEDYFKMYNVFADSHYKLLGVWELSKHIFGEEK